MSEEENPKRVRKQEKQRIEKEIESFKIVLKETTKPLAVMVNLLSNHPFLKDSDERRAVVLRVFVKSLLDLTPLTIHAKVGVLDMVKFTIAQMNLRDTMRIGAMVHGLLTTSDKTTYVA